MPKMVLTSVDQKATHRLTIKAFITASSWNNSLYHCVLKPDQTPTTLFSLKE